jgi:hypothetical protein
MTETKAGRLFVGAILLVGGWILVLSIGRHLPYLITPWSSWFRTLVVFPVLFVPLVWFLFVLRWKETGLTGYQMRMRELRSRRDRLFQRMAAGFGVVLLPAGLAWTSINFAACAAQLFATAPFAASFVVVDSTAVSSGWSLELSDRQRGETVSLYLDPDRAATFHVKDAVCVRGRSSAFGRITDSIDHSHC